MSRVTPSGPDLGIIIVSWNVRDLLAACLRSLFADLDLSGLKAQVWVVDNASTDGTPEMVAETFPAIHLIACDENLGFAAGNNLALREISNLQSPISRYVWLLNPDTEVQPGATAALVDFMERTPQAAVAGAKLLYADGSLQQSAFRFPGLVQLVFEFFPLPPVSTTRPSTAAIRAASTRGTPPSRWITPWARR